MHELALAEAVVATAQKVAEERKLDRVLKIDVRIGELQAINPRVMEDCLRLVQPQDDPRMVEAVVTFTIEKARFSCRACGAAFGLDEVGGSKDEPMAREAIHFVPELAQAFLSCPDCDGADFELAEGRSVHAAAIEGC